MRSVFVADCDGIPVPCSRREDAEAISAAWNIDHAEAIATETALDQAATVTAMDGWTGPVWDRLPRYAQTWIGYATFSVDGELLLDVPVSGRWTWEFEADWSTFPAESRVVPLGRGGVHVDVAGTDRAAAEDSFRKAKAEALRVCDGRIL
ncbi:hypothetical protein [Streptomyces sp. NBC_00207]|uniref:hypothetical protein n=1 Tax=unclassified Streptomyces TaxID=2593676 RepID=UPI002883BF60|nr:hypothetical protein [Streptomyces sp. DSM 41633]